MPQIDAQKVPSATADGALSEKQTPRVLTHLSTAGLIVISAYIAAQMMADVMSLKIALIAGQAIDAGTFIYPITFTLRDLVHKLLGKQVARRLIITAAVINLAMAGLFLFSAQLPAHPDWLAQNNWNADWFAAVLSPAWRIVLASIIAEVLSELLDTEVYHLWVTRITRRHQWARVLVSNALSVPLDSLVFCWLAFGQWGGLFPSGLPAAVVWSIFWLNILVKGGVTLISLPAIYLVPERTQHDQ